MCDSKHEYVQNARHITVGTDIRCVSLMTFQSAPPHTFTVNVYLVGAERKYLFNERCMLCSLDSK